MKANRESLYMKENSIAGINLFDKVCTSSDLLAATIKMHLELAHHLDYFKKMDSTLSFETLKEEDLNADFKKSDKTIGSFLKTNKEEEANYVLMGYPDDDGIKYNGGTTGAKEGPALIRKHFYKMTPTKSMEDHRIYDFGDLTFAKDSSLEARHNFAAKKVAEKLKHKKKVLTFGGGHDYGFADGLGFANSLSENDEVIVFNFDAHFDLRNLDKGVTSGTPFYRLNEKFKERLRLFELGIQHQCNSESLYNYAQKNTNIKTLTYEEIFPNHTFNADSFKNFVKPMPSTKKPCYVSVDIDGFSSQFAPGCSQSWPTGFDMTSFFNILDIIQANFDIRVFGIYEVSPPLDQNFKTSRLASLIAYRFLQL